MRDAIRKLVRRLRLSQFSFEVVRQTEIKNQVMDTLSSLPTNGMDDSILEDDVPVLKIAKVQTERKKTKADTKIGHSLPCDDGIATVKPALPEVLQVLDGTVDDELLTTRDFLTAETFEPTVEKLPPL